MNAIFDEDAGHLYICETPEEVRMIRRMLDLIGVSYKEILTTN